MNKRVRKQMRNNIKIASTIGNRASQATVIGGEAATLMGQPEIGVPLIAAGKFGQKGSKLLKKTSKLF